MKSIDFKMRGKLVDQLIEHEVLKLKPYYCPAGKLTIGVGRNLEDKGISQKEAVFLLKNDIDECIADLAELFKEKFDSFPDQIKMVLIDMSVFNRGVKRIRFAIKQQKHQRPPLLHYSYNSPQQLTKGD